MHKNKTTSKHILDHDCDVDSADIVMPPAEWEAFCKALDAPPRSIPSLKKLLTEVSVFDDVKFARGDSSGKRK